MKSGIGKGTAKELKCMTQGYEQWCGDCLREWGELGGGGQREKIRTFVKAKLINYNKNLKKENTNDFLTEKPCDFACHHSFPTAFDPKSSFLSGVLFWNL